MYGTEAMYYDNPEIQNSCCIQIICELVLSALLVVEEPTTMAADVGIYFSCLLEQSSIALYVTTSQCPKTTILDEASSFYMQDMDGLMD